MKDGRLRRALSGLINLLVFVWTVLQWILLLFIIILSDKERWHMGLFSKVFVLRNKDQQEEIEEPKKETVDAGMLVGQLEIIKQDYLSRAFKKENRAYARGAIHTLDEVIAIVKEMPRHEV